MTGSAGGGPRAGEGRVRLVDEIALRLGILRGLSDFLDRQRQPSGALVCRRHRVEHTGKNVYAAVIDLYNWRFTREDLYLERARRAVLRAVDNVGVDPEGGVPVFLPGRLDPRNGSSNAVDGGACADAIATLLQEAPDALSGAERDRCTDALAQHVDGYLRHAAREAPIPGQRLWAGTGVARAARLLSRPDWAADALAGCARALDELSPDGVAPYAPEGSPACSHPGLADVSSTTQARCPAFVFDIHEVLGHVASAADRQRLGRALDVLVALRDGNGRKLLCNEGKAWPWDSPYEVASHPFDVFALHRGAAVLENPLYASEAGRAMEEWFAHRDPDGGVDSHHGRGSSYECRIAWTAHAAWIARVLADVALHPAPRPPLVIDLPSAGLVHVERERCVAVLRGRHRRPGNLFGCDLGGGQLQSLVVWSNPRAPGGPERVPRLAPGRGRRAREGSFLLRPSGAPGRPARLLSLLASERAERRFRYGLARAEWSAGRRAGAIAHVVRHVLLRTLADSGPWLASHLDLETTQRVHGDEVLFEGGIADRVGRRWPGATTSRRYGFAPDRVTLVDTLRLDGVRGAVRYVLPRHLEGLAVTCTGARLSRAGAEVRLAARGGPVELTIRGHWVT